MSDTPQGPGWWLASDGKYYPPEQASAAPPPPLPPSAPPPTAGPTSTGPTAPAGPTPPAASKGGRGCIYALIAVAAVILLAFVGIFVVVAFFGHKAATNIEDAVTQKPCPFVSDAQVSSVLGSGTQAVQLTGFYAFLKPVTDTRVLADATDCVVVNNGDNTTALARLARYQGSDAQTMFSKEKDVADGTSQDQGNGLSIESESYLSNQSVTVGDEGFCTTSTLTGSSGALVRKGDTLVYVSLQPDLTSGDTTPQVDLGNGGLSTDAGNCTQAQQLAAKILG